MLRVAMVVWNEFRNDARVLKEAETLVAVGHEVTVHALHTPGITQESERLPSGVMISRVARSPLWKIRKRQRTNKNIEKPIGNEQVSHKPTTIANPNRLQQVLRIVARVWTHLGLLWRMVKLKPDVIHAHDVNTLPTAWLAAKLCGARIVYDAHEISTSREGYSNFRALVALIERTLMPRVAGTITTTDTRAKFFSRAYRIPRPLVLQNRPRLQQPTLSTRIRDELGLTENWPIVIYQGGVQQGRGLERLATIAADIPNAYFVFIGGGRLDQILRQIVTSLDIQDRVHFIPTVSLTELHSYTASADIGIQPIENTCFNHYTTDSNKLFEYVQAGLPIIASDLPEIRHLVNQHDLGLLTPPGNSEALTKALRDLVDNPELRTHYASLTTQAAKTLNWEEQEHKLIDLYARIVGASAPYKFKVE
ncbi:glycosyltransferase family 4 protein [Pseudomonas monteilii]|uniref:glycosyltransferase family 4 protein n=1 Tax=Pseudomonas TaxID=286 RepID=UPI0030D35733